MVAFYALAVAFICSLVYIPYAELRYLHRLDFRVALFCLAGAAGVFLAILPRWDRFHAPGPELVVSEQPRLFDVIDGVRRATGQKAPRHVYLLIDVNAWVAQRGGVMVIGSQRVMGLGLPLLQVLTVDEMRAVIAHEFGHYHGGDTMLGPWIHKTRMGIVRTLQAVGGGVIGLPFVADSRMFFRVTNAVSRHQEFAADALAAHVAGARALADGLTRVHQAAAAFGGYWQTEFVPALQYQVRPPLGLGFSHFMHHKQVAADLERALESAMHDAHADPYDTHPPLPERCAALAGLERQQTNRTVDARPAITLLDRVPELERELIGMAVNLDMTSFRPVSWAELPGIVWYPAWRAAVLRQAPALAGTTAHDLARIMREPESIARRYVPAPDRLMDLQQRRHEVQRILPIALVVALVDAGWELKGDLGDPVTCSRGPDALAPFDLAGQIASGKMSLDAWWERCTRLGIAALPLAPPEERVAAGLEH
jgi:Zn-dependent protease with chaperone function